MKGLVSFVFCSLLFIVNGQSGQFIIFSDSNYCYVVDFQKFAKNTTLGKEIINSEDFDVNWENFANHVDVNDSIVIGTNSIFFTDVLKAVYFEKNTIEIEEIKRSKNIRFKRKKVKTSTNQGIGGSGEKRIILIDRKSKKELVNELVFVNISC